MIKELLEEEFSNGTVEWEKRRQQQSEVLGYKLTGQSDVKVKPTPLVHQVGLYNK